MNQAQDRSTRDIARIAASISITDRPSRHPLSGSLLPALREKSFAMPSIVVLSTSGHTAQIWLRAPILTL
jgi:hypothetical protein